MLTALSGQHPTGNSSLPQPWPATVDAPLTGLAHGKWPLVPMPSSSWALDTLKGWMVSLSPNCPFRCENLIAAPGAWFLLTWLSQTDQRWNAKHCLFSHLSRTRSGAKMSLPGWSMERHISPTINTSIQQLSKSRTWSSRLSSTKPGEAKSPWNTSPSATRFCTDRTPSHETLRKPRKQREVINQYFKEVLQSVVGGRNLGCTTCSFQPPTPPENKQTV